MAGIPAEAFDFFDELAADNSKAYWSAHAELHRSAVVAPLDELSRALEPEFGRIHRFRPYRDVRFSADKSPYKLQAALSASGAHGDGLLYLHVSAAGLLVAGGYWQPATPTLVRFRRAVDDERTARGFDAVCDGLVQAGFHLEGDPLKTAPRGFARDHPRLDLLRLRSLAMARSAEPAAWMDGPRCLEWVVDGWRRLEALNTWLHDVVGPPEPRR